MNTVHGIWKICYDWLWYSTGKKIRLTNLCPNFIQYALNPFDIVLTIHNAFNENLRPYFMDGIWTNLMKSPNAIPRVAERGNSLGCARSCRRFQCFQPFRALCTKLAPYASCNLFAEQWETMQLLHACLQRSCITKRCKTGQVVGPDAYVKCIRNAVLRRHCFVVTSVHGIILTGKTERFSWQIYVFIIVWSQLLCLF